MNLVTLLDALIIAQLILCITGILASGILFAKTTVPRKRYLAGAAVVILFAAGMIVAPSARAVMNQDEQRIVLKGNPVALLNAMQGTDPKLLEGIAEIEVGPPKLILRGNDKFVAGTYVRASRSIWLAAGDQNVFTHELQHHIWYERLSGPMRKWYTRIHESSDPPTDYGRTSPEEDFADSGTLFLLGKLEPGDRREFFEFIYESVLFSPYPPVATNVSGESFYTTVLT